MRLNVLVTGLLGLASMPAQSLVAARAVGEYNPTSHIVARAFDWPTLKLSDINDELEEGKVGIVDVKGDRGKEVIGEDKAFVKIKGDNDGTKKELEVHKAIKDKDIGIALVAVLVADDDENKALGYVQKVFDVPDAKKEDAQACKDGPLKGLHDAGWLHMDPNRGNYKNIDGKWRVNDFEDSLRTNDEEAYKDAEPENDEERIDLDNKKLDALFQL